MEYKLRAISIFTVFLGSSAYEHGSLGGFCVWELLDNYKKPFYL